MITTTFIGQKTENPFSPSIRVSVIVSTEVLLLCVPGINKHTVGVVHKKQIINEVKHKHVQRTCLMYHVACKVEFQSFNNRSYSQLDVFQRTCLMYHAACKVEFQPFNRSYSQLTFFNFINHSIGQLTFFNERVRCTTQLAKLSL